MKKTKIIIGKDGSLKVEAEGYQGGTCLEKIKFLDNLFGLEKRDLKASYHEENSDSNFDILDNNPSGWCG